MFSVIIIVRQINDYLRQAMPWFSHQTYCDFEIIVVSEAEERESFPNTRIITSGRASPSRARNIGASAANGDILAFIDDDAYPAADWLEKAHAVFQDPSIGAVGGPSLVPHEATFFQRVSNKVYELSSSKTGPRYGRSPRAEIDDWPSCNFFVRKPLFDAVGGFNPEHWGGEDTQLCYGLVKAGVRMISDPDLIIYHHPRRTPRQHVRQTYFWGLWRGFMVKHHPQSLQLVFFVPALFVLALALGSLAAAAIAPLRPCYLILVALVCLYMLTIAIRSRHWALAAPVAGLTLLTLMAYGIGFLRGLASREAPTRKTMNPSEGATGVPNTTTG